jgi:hypothetical protein
MRTLRVPLHMKECARPWTGPSQPSIRNPLIKSRLDIGLDGTQATLASLGFSRFHAI